MSPGPPPGKGGVSPIIELLLREAQSESESQVPLDPGMGHDRDKGTLTMMNKSCNHLDKSVVQHMPGGL